MLSNFRIDIVRSISVLLLGLRHSDSIWLFDSKLISDQSLYEFNSYSDSIQIESSSIQFLFIPFELNVILFEFNLLLLSARIDGNCTKDASKNHDSCPIWSHFVLSSHSDRIPDTRFSDLVWFDLKLERNNFRFLFHSVTGPIINPFSL